MTQTENVIQPQPASLVKRMLIGAAIGFVLISLFLFSAGEGNPAWGKFWMIRPLIMTPFAGAMGGLCNYYIMHIAKQRGVNKIWAIILSVIVFIFGLWIGTILGLDDTWWD
jgi:cytochrome bd-type quinol oxidase subunit 2